MRFTAALTVALAGLAAAQSATTSSSAADTATTTTAASGATATSGCGSQVDDIIQTCLGTEDAQLSSCAANDWDCLCTQSTNVLTCYNNCPSDPNAFGAQQQQTSYCNAAKAYGSSSSSLTVSATASVSSPLASALASESSTLSAATAASASATTTSHSSATSSASASAASASSTKGAANMLTPAGGALAAVFGAAVLL